MFLNTQALVLRVTNYGDADAILTLLTKKNGQLTVRAKGLRRKNSPLAAPCQVLAYGEFTLFDYKGRYTVNEAHSIELFRKLREDITALSLGCYFSQVAEALSQEDEPNPELLSLTLNCLYALCQGSFPQNQVKAGFELRAACLAGYTPGLFGCHACRNPFPEHFNISSGLLECTSCAGTEFSGIRMPVEAGVLSAMRYICNAEIGKLLSFKLSACSMDKLSSITESYLAAQLEQGFSTLDFYKSLFYLETRE